jgi:hypothetical protein
VEGEGVVEAVQEEQCGGCEADEPVADQGEPEAAVQRIRS